MKKLINDPSGAVREMLEGVALLNTDATVLPDENVVVRVTQAEPGERKVAVLSGGGSGHEPAHAGYVGRGMLTGAIAGDVFTSPSTDSVLEAIRAVSGPAGALLIVKNYTGDRLNFGLAAELARAEGIPVEVVIVADDVALRDTVPPDRRRGIAGTVFVHKVAGAAAEQGASLSEVVRLARTAAQSVASMGISLGSCTLPAVGKPGFTLGEQEIEVGLGIHGEQGVRRTSICSADELCKIILDTMDADKPFVEGERVAVLVNGLGATPPMELSIVTRGAIKQLQARQVRVERAWSGTFLSALDMPGFSLSVLRLDEQLSQLLDAPTDAPSWPGRGEVNTHPLITRNVATTRKTEANVEQTVEGKLVQEAAIRAAKALIAAEAELTELDSIAGDGDLGISMTRAGEAVLALDAADFADPAVGLSSMGNALRRAIGGSSGPFYATGLLRASRHLGESGTPTAQAWAQAFKLGVEAVSQLGGAQPGDRTMVDALKPAADRFTGSLDDGASPQQALQEAAIAATEGAGATKAMRPRLGRASYVGERVVGHADGGAVAVAIWMQVLASSK